MNCLLGLPKMRVPKLARGLLELKEPGQFSGADAGEWRRVLE